MELSAGYITISRFILPALAIWLLLRCVRSMLRQKYEPETWAYICLPDGTNRPLFNWECTLGRSPLSDAVIDYPTVSRSHAVVIRDSKGRWRLYDLKSTGGTWHSGERIPVKGLELYDGCDFTLADVPLRFADLSGAERHVLEDRRSSPSRHVKPMGTFLVLTLFQLVLALQHFCTAEPDYTTDILLSFAALAAAEWCYFFIMRALSRTGFEPEAIALFLTTLGLSVAASSVPSDMFKQVVLILAGMLLFVVLGWWLRDLPRARALRWPAAFAALGFLALNLLVSEELFGARNWIYIAGFSLQPSEFVKIAYIYAGAATLDRLYMGRNLFLYVGFSAVCVGALAVMGDFGTALVFFVTFLVISYMRSGNIGTVVLAISSAALAGFLALTARPHIAQRFATWGHVWEDASGAGYQQTRALSAAAGGGLFGVGGGAGWLQSIVAADTDMVFGVVCEELGLIVAVCAVLSLVFLALFVVRGAANGRSSFYVIAAGAAVSMMLVQLGLNVFGAMDILPFTGVTFPFVSRGGSSLVSCWALLAFIKASDTRQSASFSVKPPSKFRDAPGPARGVWAQPTPAPDDPFAGEEGEQP